MQFKSICKGIVLLAAVVGNLAQATPISGQGTWETTLQARDLDSDGVADAFYDTDLNITWLRDVNANIGYSGSTGIGNHGIMSIAQANTWISNLAVGGVDGWRLPTMTDPDPVYVWNVSGTTTGYNVLPSSSEMAHLFFSTLGNRSPVDAQNRPQAGSGLSNTGNFQNFDAGLYMSGTEPSPGWVWYFDFRTGYQALWQPGMLYVMAVHDGDVAPVPEPTTLALLGFALAGLGATRRKKAI